MEAVPQNRKHYIQVRSPLCRDRLCAVVPPEHPLAACTHVTIEKLLEYPLIIETPGCDNDILHLLNECADIAGISGGKRILRLYANVRVKITRQLQDISPRGACRTGHS